MLGTVIAGLALLGSGEGKTVYDFRLKDIDGQQVALSKFRGQVLLLVNVASMCGNTPQYEGLQRLYLLNKDKGFAVLGFPANEFGGQEPGRNQTIKEFCTKNYSVTFPMFSKIVVKGEKIHPLYEWLISSSEPKKEIEWNFAKFLIGRDGKVLARFAPKTQPESEEVLAALSAALDAKPPKDQPKEGEKAAFLCGAPTKAGGTCQRKVKAEGERCYQHKG